MEKTENNANNLPVQKSPSAMIELAISKGADLDKLEKLLDLQERFEKNEAKKAYHSAMALFKANPPEIDKDRKVSFGTGKAAYSHATLFNASQKINTALSQFGLSATWKTNQEGDKISVTCKITHEMGHSEETTLTASPDTSGSKNPIQAIGSTVSYLERYTLLAATGLASKDMDDDAEETTETIDEKQLGQIVDMINETGHSEKLLLKWQRVENLEDIRASNFKKVMSMLQAKADKK